MRSPRLESKLKLFMPSPPPRAASYVGLYHTSDLLRLALAVAASFLDSISTSPFPVEFSTFPQSPCKRTPQHPRVGRFRGIPRLPSPVHSARLHPEFPEAQLARPRVRLALPERRS